MSKTNPLPDDVNALKELVADLQSQLKERKRKSFWAVESWQDALKIISIPIALVLGWFTFWDQVVLRSVGRDAASIEEVAANVDALQQMDQELYVLRSSGDAAQAEAAEAAIIAKRERTVAETFDYWKNNPAYFRSAELQILIHHLVVQHRTDDALDVFETYSPTLKTAFQKANGKLLEARIYAREGPIQNLQTGREKLADGMDWTEQITRTSDRTMMQGQLVYFRVIIELDRAEDCPAAEPFVAALEKLASVDNTGVVRPLAAELHSRMILECA